MIHIQDLSLYRGANCLLNQASFTAHPGWHIGLTGRNGTGKSSLFAMLLGNLHADSGELTIPREWRIAHMAQEVPALERSAIDYVIDGDQELRQLETALHSAEQDHNDYQIAHLHQQLDSIDAYSARARAAKLLTGLGFQQQQLDSPVKSFSGGWRMRMNLAQTLMCRSDCLLLDEPTNHLDLDAILWLEQWLQQYPGTLVLISHDRDFLDATVNHILHIEHQTLNHYKGNYSQFELLRAQRLQLQQAAYDKQQVQIAHMQSFIARFKAKASKARQAQSRVKALEKLEALAPAHVDSPFHFEFFPPKQLGDPLIRLDHAELGYGDTTILHNVNLQLRPDTRLGLLGPNGAGKSTLIQSLTGDLALVNGELQYSEHCVIGYFAQHQVDHLDLQASPLQIMQRMAPDTEELRLRAYLGSFDFRGDRVQEKIDLFSGGEKARLALALIIWKRPNVLLLDEPTNHLDLEMRHALTVAMQSYQGALVVVSHDRHLIQNTTDELYLVANGQVAPFSGDLKDYATWLDQQQSANKPVSSNNDNKVDRKVERQRAADLRNQLRPLKKRLSTIESKLEKLNQENLVLEAQLADTDLYLAEKKATLTALLQRKGVLQQQIDDTESEWLELLTELEELESNPSLLADQGN
jgi:ATP-binding cassette subfamily F protein 3